MIFRPPTAIDADALLAQLRDGISAPDGVLSFEQALALVEEVRRLRSAVAERDGEIDDLNRRVRMLMGMLS